MGELRPRRAPAAMPIVHPGEDHGLQGAQAGALGPAPKEFQTEKEKNKRLTVKSTHFTLPALACRLIRVTKLLSLCLLRWLPPDAPGIAHVFT